MHAILRLMNSWRGGGCMSSRCTAAKNHPSLAVYTNNMPVHISKYCCCTACPTFLGERSIHAYKSRTYAYDIVQQQFMCARPMPKARNGCRNRGSGVRRRQRAGTQYLGMLLFFPGSPSSVGAATSPPPRSACVNISIEALQQEVPRDERSKLPPCRQQCWRRLFCGT